MEKKYRKIKKTDKFPNLPKEAKPRYILKEKGWTFVFAESGDVRYTFEWDGVSLFWNRISSESKDTFTVI